MAHSLALLHTAGIHVEAFDNLAIEIREEEGVSLALRHFVHPELLQHAREHGLDGGLRDDIHGILRNIGEQGFGAVICTCSSVGGLAEQAAAALPLRVSRIDRQMARDAVKTGNRLLVVASVASTLEPTRELLQEEARNQGRALSLHTLLCEQAWTHFIDGRIRQYLDEVETAIRACPDEIDAVVLAQASMSALERRDDFQVPVLGSPRRGLLAVSRME